MNNWIKNEQCYEHEEEMLKGAMNQVVTLSRELEDNRDLLAHSELDTSYYKKIGENIIKNYKNWKRNL